MPLKFKYRSQSEIPPEHAALYLQHDGAWLLDADGAVDKSKLDESRAANAALAKERDDLKKRFEGIDPDEVRRLADEKRHLEEAAQLKAGEIDKVIDARVRAVKDDLGKKLAATLSERDALNARLAAIQIDQAVVAEATKRGLRPTAIPDITARARAIFRLVNGVPQPFEPDGQTPRTGRDGLTPLNLPEWLDLQLAEAPHLFEPNAGAGAAGTPNGGAGASLLQLSASTGGRSASGSGSGSSRSGAIANPFRKETWNLTEQMRLQKYDPALAARLRSTA